MNRIYLDCAATTPIDKEVEKAMKPYFDVKFGNPNSLHFFGQEARKAIDASREKIAKIIGAQFDEVIFTGSATEANNLALRGAIKKLKSLKNEGRIKIVVSAIEHESVLDTAKDLKEEGMEVEFIPVNKFGVVDLEKLREMLDERTALVSVMYVNNEVGSVQPIKEISNIIADYKREKAEKGILSNYPLFHVDAVQAFNYFKCNVDELGIDLMTLSAHKVYGPKGVGLLYSKKNKLSESKQNYFMEPIITGGGQEKGLRSGTENVAYIVGFAKALELSDKGRKKEVEKIKEFRDYFTEKLLNFKLSIMIHNDFRENPELYSPHIINLGISNMKANDALIALDLKGLAVSAGSACMSYVAKPSYVLKAIGLPGNKIDSAIRISIGRFTTQKDLDGAIEIFKIVLG